MDRVDEPVFIVKRLAGKLVVYLSSFVMSLARGRYLRVWNINREIIILKRLGGEDNFSQRNWTILRKAGVDIGQVGREVKLERKRARKRSEGFRTKGQNVKREMKERVSKITRVKEWQYFAFSSPFPLLYATFSVSSSNN